MLLVVGSENSSNAARLVEVGEVCGVFGRLIDRADDIEPDWLKGISVVGVTGGASTPDAVVQSVIDRLGELGSDEVELCSTAEESTVFQLPESLRAVEKSLANSEAVARGSRGEA